MITKHTHRNLTWVDLQSPTNEEVRQVVEEYHIHPLVGHELLAPTLRPKVDLYENCIYLILHFPTTHTRKSGRNGNQEVDFIIGKDFIITTCYDAIDPLHKFAKIFEVNSILDKSHMGSHAGYVFYYMLSKIYESLIHKLESIKDSIQDIEHKIFTGKEKEMVFALSNVSRNLLDFKRALSLHDEILKSFEVAGKKFFGEEFGYHLRAILGEYYKIEGALKNNVEFVNELRDTNDSLLTAKQNELMKTFSVIAFIAVPLTLIASIFQIDLKARPIVGTENDFWVIILLLVAVAALLFSFFKYKKWL